MTLSALEGHSPIASLLMCDIFALVLLFIYFILTYLLTYFWAVGLYNHCMHGTLSQCTGSVVMLPLDPKLLV